MAGGGAAKFPWQPFPALGRGFFSCSDFVSFSSLASASPGSLVYGDEVQRKRENITATPRFYGLIRPGLFSIAVTHLMRSNGDWLLSKLASVSSASSL